MRNKLFSLLSVMVIAGTTATAFAQVSVDEPSDGQTVSPSAHFAASAEQGSCPYGVASMGVYIDDQLVYTVDGSNLDATVPVPHGQHRAVVQEWDYCGGATKTLVNITAGGTTLTGLQAKGGWNQWGELPPAYGICDAPCWGQVNWSMYQHRKDVSLSGDATQFNTGGPAPYADVLWSYPFIGDGAPGDKKDHEHQLLTSIHNFSMDEDVFVTNLSATQNIELDVNMFFNGVGMEWGTQCDNLGDGVWDIWDNVNAHWMPTDAPCILQQNAWNHAVVQVQRQPNNDLLYQTISMNGVTYQINRTVAPFEVPEGWWGANLNFQMDANSRSAQNTEYVDNLNVTYW